MANFVLNSSSDSVALQRDDNVDDESCSLPAKELNIEEGSFEVEDVSMEEDDALVPAINLDRRQLALGTQVDGHKVAQRLYSLAPVAHKSASLGPRQPSSTSLPTSPTQPRKFAQSTWSRGGGVGVGGGVGASQRHYKKDSCYVLDLYTLTFDEDETVDDVATRRSSNVEGGAAAGVDHLTYGAIAMPSLSLSIKTNGSSGPLSLQSSASQSLAPGGSLAQPQSLTTQTLPSLETNLHKILARKIQDSEEMTFRKAKLLTKAYYKLLRESTTPLVDPQVQVLQHRVLHRQQAGAPARHQHHAAGAFGARRLTWQELLGTDTTELRRIVGGLGNAVRALNDYLMELLQERDDLLGNQDEMLEEISELTDSLL